MSITNVLRGLLLLWFAACSQQSQPKPNNALGIPLPDWNVSREQAEPLLPGLHESKPIDAPQERGVLKWYPRGSIAGVVFRESVALIGEDEKFRGVMLAYNAVIEKGENTRKLREHLEGTLGPAIPVGQCWFEWKAHGSYYRLAAPYLIVGDPSIVKIVERLSLPQNCDEPAGRQ